MFRRNASAHGEVDLLKEVQGSEGQTTVQDAAEEYEIIYSKDDVVALKHNYKRYIIPFFQAVLLKDLIPGRSYGFEMAETVRRRSPCILDWDRDDRNSPKCIIGKVQIIKDGNNFCLSCLEEQRLVALLQGSVESDDSPASGGHEEEGEQAPADNFSEPIRFEAGRSRSGRPTTRCVL